jgi:aminoacrylate hydrolase
MPLATFADTTLHYTMRGNGSSVLMLLPQSSGPEGRESILSGLASRHQLIHYAQRGTGQSSAATKPMSMQLQAADALAVLDAVGGAAAHLVCHSTGCGIGLALADAYGDRIKSLSLINPWTWGDPYLTQMQRMRVAAARALDPTQYAQFNASLLFPPDYRRRLHPQFAQLAVAAQEKPQNADEIEQRLEAILAFDARPALARLSQPSLVVSSSDDQLMPAWFAHEAAEGLASAQLHVLDGGGHMLLETRACELLPLLLSHIASVDNAV